MSNKAIKRYFIFKPHLSGGSRLLCQNGKLQNLSLHLNVAFCLTINTEEIFKLSRHHRWTTLPSKNYRLYVLDRT